MDIAIVGTGFVGRVLGRALSHSGHAVIFGSRHPDQDDVSGNTTAQVSIIGAAIARADVVILALPGAAVSELTLEHGNALAEKLVIDATNQVGQPASNSRAALPSSVRYARAFNTVSGEVMENPVFPDGTADMFFTAPETDSSTVEEVITGVGLQPVYVGPDREDLMDALFRLWIALAAGQHRGRHLALRLLEG